MYAIPQLAGSLFPVFIETVDSSCSKLCGCLLGFCLFLSCGMENPAHTLVECRRRMRALQQRKRRLEARMAKSGCLSPRDVDLACLVHTFSQNSRAAAAHFVRGWGRRSKPKAHSDASVEELVEDVVWSCQAGLAETAPLMDQVLAARYVLEYKLFHWLYYQNTVQGVAPTRSQLVEKAQAFIPKSMSVEGQERVRSLVAGEPRAQRKWLARFRQHWGARLGILRVQDALPVDVLQAKAALFVKVLTFLVLCFLCAQKIRSRAFMPSQYFCWQRSGFETRRWPQTWATQRPQNEVRSTGSFLGPFCGAMKGSVIEGT
jgi:hypothetical protein